MPIPKHLRTPAQLATEDLRKELPIHRTGTGFAKSGAPELAWLRGHQAGIYDAYKLLRRKYPDAALSLLTQFSMNPNGTIG